MVASADARYTNKVITLWYRPPELILGETVYGPSVDLWSAGFVPCAITTLSNTISSCILAELIEKKVLFGGDLKERPDIMQLDVIWEVVGTPNDENWPAAKKYSLYKEPKKVIPSSLKERFAPYASS